MWWHFFLFQLPEKQGCALSGSILVFLIQMIFGHIFDKLKVLAITEGLHDIYSLEKEASTTHSALMTDFSKVSNLSKFLF